MNTEEKDRKEYEVAVLVRSEEDIPGIAALVREHGGELTAGFRAKRVALAYPIKKEKEGIFAYANFRAVGDTAKALEKDLNVRHDVLRSLVIKPPKPQEKHVDTRELPHKRASVQRPTPSAPVERPAPASWPLSNEALEKKIEEILK
jgi:ribosomal protein S6